MSFVQSKLIQVASQSSDVSNLYVYQPDNGDASTDVVGSDYFAQSRYIGQNGWIDGIIFCTLSDGFFMIQVGADGTTAAQVGAGGSEITDLSDSIRGGALIDMGNDDYTMTDAEAIAAVKLVTNVGDGTKTLTSPTTADSLIPVQSFFISIGAKPVTIEMETGGASAILYSGQKTDIEFIPTLGVFSCALDYSKSSNAVSGGVQVSAVLTNDFQDTDCGQIIFMTSTAGQQAWDIHTTADEGFPDNARLTVSVPAGKDGIIVGGAIGVTLIPPTPTAAAGETLYLYKDGATDTWYSHK